MTASFPINKDHCNDFQERMSTNPATGSPSSGAGLKPHLLADAISLQKIGKSKPKSIYKTLAMFWPRP
jgi:hypothetical protein